MKKIILFTSLFTFIIGVQAQTVSINKFGETVDLSGGQIAINNTTGTEEIIDLEVKNETGGDLSLKITRLRLDVPATGWSDLVCWQYGTLGYCYPANAANPWTTNTALTIPPAEYGKFNIHITPSNSPLDNGHYRYYVLNVDTEIVEDSIDVTINSILNIKENKQASSVVSVLPNPADNYLTISVPNGSECTIKLTDILGKTIYDERFSNSKKLDVNSYKNGVYVAVINVNGVNYTKRFVVKH